MRLPDRLRAARAWLGRQRALTVLAILLAFFVVSGMAGGAILYVSLASGLPNIQDVEKDYRPPIITRVLDADGRLMGEFALERRIVVPVSEMPGLLVKAFVAAEDKRFFEHSGIDFMGLVRAAIANLTGFGRKQGGSTITMQVAKTFFLADVPRDLKYKLRQIILAYRLERHLSKEQILYLYLNQIYLGHGAYGVGAAAQVYFGKEVKDLTLPEAALLAGLPQAPSSYSPYSNPDQARVRRTYVLERMREEGYATTAEAEAAAAAPLVTKVERLEDLSAAAFFNEHVRQYLQAKYGADAVYREGLTVHTTARLDLQIAAQEAIERGLRTLDKREGYRGPITQLDTAAAREAFLAEEAREIEGEVETSPPTDPVTYRALVTKVDPRGADLVVGGSVPARLPLEEMAWARRPNPDADPAQHQVRDATTVLELGDVVLVSIRSLPSGQPRKGGKAESRTAAASLEQEPLVQGALLAMDPETGAVRAMVGGFDFRQTQFNRAVQARRQPGSAFKPIIYAAALDSPKGFTPASIIIDSPVIEDTEELQWRPKNFDGRFHGPTTLREALTYSRNLVSIRLLDQIGVGYAIDYARTLGITAPLARDLSLALGSSGVSLLELVRAYAVFAARGDRPEPLFVTKVVDREGNVLEENQPVVTPQVISPETAFIMTNILTGVVQDGTAQRVKALGRPVAGKTGTTNDLNDAWFVGYTPSLAAGVWVGFDDLRSLGLYETGSRAASPIWLDFMQDALQGEAIRAFLPAPPGVVFARIDAKSGKLATAATPAGAVIYESFKEGSAPTEYATGDPFAPIGPVDLRIIGEGQPGGAPPATTLGPQEPLRLPQ